MKDKWDTIRFSAILLTGIVSLFIVADVADYFFYDSKDFTARVESIDFYGRSFGFGGGTDKVVIRFSDGAVYNLYKLPDGLKEGHTYRMEWQQPYIISAARLVIIAEIAEGDVK